MKIYVHYEPGGGDADFTKIFKYAATSADTVQDLLDAFVSAYNQQCAAGDPPAALDIMSVRVVDARQRPVTPTRSVLKAFQNLDDVYIEHIFSPILASAKQQGASTASISAQASASTATYQLGTYPVASSEKARPSSVASAAVHNSALVQAQPVVNQTPDNVGTAGSSVLHRLLLHKGEAAAKDRKYRQAFELYQQLLNIAPRHATALSHMAALWLEAGQPAKAEFWAHQALEVVPLDATLHELLGDCVRAQERPEEALGHYQIALGGHCNVLSATSSQEHEHSVQVKMASCMYAITHSPSYQDTAANLVMDVLQKDESHWEGLYLYATIALDRGLLEDAIKVSLRLLVAKPEHSAVRALLTRCVEAPSGIELLMAQLAGGENCQAAFAFLATCIKDHGAVDSAVHLFQEAVRLSPTSSQYSLSLVHSLELQHASDAAIEAVQAFCSRATVVLGGGVTLKQVLSMLEGLPKHGKMTSMAWLDSEPWAPPPGKVATCVHAPATAEAAAAAAAAASAGGASAVAAANCAAAAAAVPATVQGSLGTDLQAAPAPSSGSAPAAKLQYSDEQLDTLALLFTIVKVLYIGGALATASRLTVLLQKARDASKQELHTTKIRNEAAYFGCVQQLLQECPPPSYPPAGSANLRPLYLCGDSHCLPGAWHTVSLRGEPRILFPALVTGCKIWHIRPASCFYPKVQFLNTVHALPQGAQVIFMFGEIDCREGLLVAVQKCKYESVEQAMRATLDIYVSVLMDLIKCRGFEIFVHPIAPVLNETRPIVKPFAAAMARHMRRACKLPEAQGRLHYLDFFDSLLTPDGSALDPNYQFDGTHLSPNYVPLLGEHLASIA